MKRIMLQAQLKHIDFPDEAIETLDKELAERKKNDVTFHESLELLDGIITGFLHAVVLNVQR